MRRAGILAAGVLLAASVGGAQPASLDAVAFLAGTWTGEEGGVSMEEHWTKPAGGLMLGLHRDVAPGKPAFFEFLRIEATPKGIVYLASPRGAPPTPFPLVESGGNRAVFENRKHDFPTRIIYRLKTDGSLHARIEGTKEGKPAFEEWTWRKVR
ncbi:MAG TPA: DUF6265 family protein [Thermoanaerobaculia bacterium]|nr:DUF6265 family protein [Thermoanaerobaculia bacterium]